MNLLAHLLSPETMRIVALTLLHFLWQGAALAAVAYVSLSLLRSASTRYTFLVGLLGVDACRPHGYFFCSEFTSHRGRFDKLQRGELCCSLGDFGSRGRSQTPIHGFV